MPAPASQPFSPVAGHRPSPPSGRPSLAGKASIRHAHRCAAELFRSRRRVPGEAQAGMKTIVVANQKGGVGKTAVAVHLAFDFAERGARVAMIDLDTQGNASFTLHRHTAAGVTARAMFDQTPIGPIEAVDGLALVKADSRVADMQAAPIDAAADVFGDRLAEIGSQGFDYAVIDTGPALATPLMAALLNADYALSPVELEAYSAIGIKQMVALLDKVKVANAKMTFLGMVASKVNGRSQRHAETLESLQRAYPRLVLPVRIGQRESIAQAAVERVPVWQVPKSSARSAAQEMRALAQHVFDAINKEA